MTEGSRLLSILPRNPWSKSWVCEETCKNMIWDFAIREVKSQNSKEYEQIGSDLERPFFFFLIYSFSYNIGNHACEGRALVRVLKILANRPQRMSACVCAHVIYYEMSATAHNTRRLGNHDVNVSHRSRQPSGWTAQRPPHNSFDRCRRHQRKEFQRRLLERTTPFHIAYIVKVILYVVRVRVVLEYVQ